MGRGHTRLRIMFGSFTAAQAVRVASYTYPVLTVETAAIAGSEGSQLIGFN